MKKLIKFGVFIVYSLKYQKNKIIKIIGIVFKIPKFLRNSLNYST